MSEEITFDKLNHWDRFRFADNSYGGYIFCKESNTSARFQYGRTSVEVKPETKVIKVPGFR